MAECAKHNLLEQIAQCEFILIDINLFLDTHPNDVRAIEDTTVMPNSFTP